MANVVNMPTHPCQFCKKNEATQLCDFVVGYAWTTAKDLRGHMIGQQYLTCDNEVCKECMVKVATFEFCPSCHKLHQMVQEKHDRRPRTLPRGTYV